MNNKFFNFVDYLTKKDINTVLGLMGYRLLNESDNRNGTLNSHLIKRSYFINKQNEEHNVICFCKRLTKEEMEEMKIQLPPKLAACLAIASGIVASSSYSSNDISVVVIENFCAYESYISLMGSETKNLQSCTKALYKFMREKFGSFYGLQRQNYISKLKKEAVVEQSEKDKQDEQEVLE